MQATYDDANLILRLYELRREDKMRDARAWFVGNFKPKTLAQLNELCPPGTENNARMRMVSSYWDMVASFVASGVLNEELFYASGRESLVVWLRMEPVVKELREAHKDPTALQNLEAVSIRHKDYLNRVAPGTYDAFAARMRG